jgi:signal transduction histidine kinase
VTKQDSLPALAALRQARANREDWRRRLMAPLVPVTFVAVVLTATRSHPGPGLHGKSLGVTIALAGLVAGALAAAALQGAFRDAFRDGLRLMRPGWTWRSLVILALPLLSGAVLDWLQPEGTGIFALIVVAAAAVRLVPGRASVIVLVLCLATPLVKLQLIGVLALCAVYTMSVFRERVWQQEEQADQLLAELEDSRGAELRAAALSERQRLARDMHDVLAHSLSGLVLQLEGARLLVLADPADPRLAGTIDRAHELAKSGLDEARQAIGMLRDDELPGPDALAGLAAAFEADTGVGCQFTVSGDGRELPAQARLALYRVTQEALTNVRKHARADRVEVQFSYRPGEVCLAIEDYGTAPPPVRAGSGYGITGMRERAELLGGTLTAGPTGSGFRIQLRVPT